MLSAVPADCDVSGYSTEQLLAMMRMLKVSEKVLQSWYQLAVDGRAFAAMSDDDLRLYKIDLPLVRQLRDCTRTSLQQKCNKPDGSAQYDDGYVKFRRNKDS